MKNLIVDIGNTRVKVAVMSGDEVICDSIFEAFDGEALRCVEGLVGQYGVLRGIVSSTRGDGERVTEMLRGVLAYVLHFDAGVAVPIRNSYLTLHSLGRDRLAAAVGAATLYGEESDAQLVIDMGSAITIDLITREGGFEGGVISAGVSMRFRALHEFTAGLPLCDSTDVVLDVARTTKDAIEQGVMEGVRYEIEGHIEAKREKFDEILVIFMGGDAKKFANRIKNAIFAQRELVLVGLNRILEYNAE